MSESAQKTVFPGTVLTTAEEYLAGKNTQEMENGDIVSVCVGMPRFDKVNRVVDVERLAKHLHPLEVGAIVFGKVVLVKESMVIVEMHNAEKDGKGMLIPNRSAAIPVFSVSQDYVKTLSGLFRVGDIVKAQVEKITPFGIDLTTKGKDLGVVVAFCKMCRHEMERFGKEIKCTACGFTEEKMVSDAYQKK